MKSKDKKNIQTQSREELINMLTLAKKDMFTLQMDLKRNKLKNTRQIFEKRKVIARILTAIREKELAAETAEI